jgi:hypothetical protein
MKNDSSLTAEGVRLSEDRTRMKKWKRWGLYLSERQWATVREDYSPYGNCWDYFPHDHARSRVYRWGEDGLLGFTDRECRLCFALALWNGHDPILKERLFGLTGSEGNHGQDVKENYYYMDATPTYSYARALYKYPQSEFPYSQLVEENRQRGLSGPEFELADTGVFNDNRYFDVQVEYAKAALDDLLIQISATNRGSEVFGALAQYERAMTKERIVAGLAAARLGGRPPAITGEKLDAIIGALHGGMSKAAVCRNFAVKRTTLIETLARVSGPASG